MMETNSAILDHLAESEATAAAKRADEQERARAVYWSILSDPTRTSTADKSAMAAAMKTLGKSIAQADADAEVVQRLREWPEVCAQSSKAQDAVRAAEQDHLAFMDTYRAEVQKLKQKLTDKIMATKDRERERDGASQSVKDARAFLDAHAATVEEAERFLKV